MASASAMSSMIVHELKCKNLSFMQQLKRSSWPILTGTEMAIDAARGWKRQVWFGLLVEREWEGRTCSFALVG